MDQAKAIIQAAEYDLGSLTDGQRRDLLMDNTDWSRQVIADIVNELREIETQG